VGCGVWGVGCEVWGVGCEVWGVGCGVWGVGCGVWGVGCGVRGVKCGVWGVGSHHVGLHVGLLLVSIEDLAVCVAGPQVVDLGFGGWGSEASQPARGRDNRQGSACIQRRLNCSSE